MPDPSLTCPCSALQSGVASRRLLPTQNSGEPQILTEDLTLASDWMFGDANGGTGQVSRIAYLPICCLSCAPASLAKLYER